MTTLEDREAGLEPARRPGFRPPTNPAEHAAYVAEFHHWRAIRRDARLTNAELDASFRVLAERLGYPDVGLWDGTL